MPPSATPPSRRGAALRLGGLVAGLAVVGGIFAVSGTIGAETVRDWIAPAGAAGPVAYLVLAAVLGAVLVPGAALAAASGLLFGVKVGALVSLLAAVLSAVLARTLSARVGGAALDRLAGHRVQRLTALARRNGLAAVIVQRLLPAVPDAPFSHAFGLAGIRTRDVAWGTLIASGPRALAYALIGAHADDLASPGALAGFALYAATAALGLLLAWAHVRREARRGLAR